MDGLNPAFKILTCFGFWKPISWPDPWSERLYDSVRVFLVALPYYLALGQILRLLLDTISIDEMADTLFSTMSAVNVCCKLTNILWRKKEVAELMDMLMIEWTRPMNEKENVLYSGFNDTIRLISQYFTSYRRSFKIIFIFWSRIY